MRPVALLLLALLTACSSTTQDQDNPFRPESFQPRGGELQIFVDNLNFADATLTVQHDAGRTRLGTVGGKSRGQFRIPWTGVRDLRIRIDLLASHEWIPPPLSVGPVDQVSVTVDTVITRSRLLR